ncbi:HEAT repeat domain-containing protein [Actinocorallia longicatena]|uniref:HEAT repeat domain-containing protein n=1 Tax=Actinocorallia longicatena TaxID=111803 RepID=A0ABP6QNK7_9ACTN
MSRQRFDRAMERMRSQDVRLRQDGFDFVREHADSYVTELIEEFGREPAGELRRWLLELIAEARSEEALPVFAAVLDGHDEDLRFWAIRGLEELDTPLARRELERAGGEPWSY